LELSLKFKQKTLPFTRADLDSNFFNNEAIAEPETNEGVRLRKTPTKMKRVQIGEFARI
jgi:hypothetical protein